MKKFKTIFLGNPEFSLTTLEALNDHKQIELVAVCGSMDKPVGRGKKVKSPPTIEFAKDNHIKFFQSNSINKDERFIDFCSKEKPDIFIVLAFSHFLSQRILDIPNIGCFNIHTSILPKYRGSSPIHYALLNGDKSTGVSIQKMVKKMDAGDIGYFASQEIQESDDYLSLSNKLAYLSGRAITSFIDQLANEKINFKPQNEENVSFASLIKKEDGLVSFTETASQIINKTRAFSVWPGTFFSVNGKIFKFKNIEAAPGVDLKPTEIKIEKKEIFIGCADHAIKINQIQPQGKPMMDAQGFINGYRFESNKVDL